MACCLDWKGYPPGRGHLGLSKFTCGRWLFFPKEINKEWSENHGALSRVGFEGRFWVNTWLYEHRGKAHIKWESRWAYRKQTIWNKRSTDQNRRPSGCGSFGANGINSQQILVYIWLFFSCPACIDTDDGNRLGKQHMDKSDPLCIGRELAEW